MNHRLFVAVIVGAVGAAAATAQVSVSKQQADDKSASKEQVTVSTMDRSFVALTIETTKTRVDADTKRVESATRARLNDGTYFDWRTSVAVQKQVALDRTETVQDVVEKDRQGGTRTVLQVKQETSKTADGELNKATEYRRDSSGAMQVNRVTTASTVANPDGGNTTTSTEQVLDVNGRLQPQQQTLATAAPLSATETQITTQVRQYNHLDGAFGVVSRETAKVTMTGGSTRTERLIQQPKGAGWNDVGRVVTIETRQPDGSLVRETVEEGRSLFSRTAAPPMDVQPLVAQRKIVEREVRQSDGTTVIQRDILRRDVNGEWKQQSFSTDTTAQP